MEVGAFIPVKKRSSRLPNKNFREFNGYPLYEHFFRKLHPTNPFDSVYVNTDSEEVKRCAKKYGFNIIERPPYLSEDDANGNDLILFDADQIEVDIYFQLFVTAPLLKQETIRYAYDKITTEDNIDSVFIVERHNSFFWQDGESINYDPKNLPRTQDLNPMYEETTGLYAIKRESLLDLECRIGHNPEYIEVNNIEAIDIDVMSDLELARIVDQRTPKANSNEKNEYDLLDKY